MTTNNTNLLHERDAAKILKVSIAWMQKARYLGNGPTFVKVGGPNGRAVRYRYQDIVEYIESNLVSSPLTSKRGH